jgi:hypothetical protein
MIRRVFLLFVLLPLAVVASLGQDNQNATEMDEIFQKGRKWIVMGEALVSPSVGRRVFIINGYECEGDTVVDGHLYSVLSCYSMYDIDNPFDVDEETLFSAEGKRTWKNTGIYREGFKYYQYAPRSYIQNELILDFAVNKGDTLLRYTPSSEYSNYPMYYTLLVEDVGDTILENSSDKRLRKWVRVDDWGWGEDIWVEGIGSLRGGPSGSQFDLAGVTYTLFKCFDDENIYYSNQTVPWDKNLILSIRNVEDTEADCNRNDGVQETYTLQGIKTDTPSKGIRIIRYSDGTVKKVYTR